jgi:FKBP-type peptidyl-prolyl cis-trans isomerase FkpA
MAFQTGASGLGIDDVEIGTGKEARPGQHVSVHYTGWLWEADASEPEGGRAGSKFDSSKDRGQPFDFPLGAGHVISGWDQGVAGMKVGGKRRLLIPASLGYGARGAGGVIPPNATLLFEVDLLAA